MAMTEKHVLEEAKNLRKHHVLFPGDSLSHVTLNECIQRGWAKRIHDGFVMVTDKCPFKLVR